MLVLITALALSGVAVGQDLACPQVLGISKTASIDEIRGAYRREALQWHPDRNPDNQAANDRFIAITNCYERMKSGTLEDGRSPSDDHHSNSQDVFNDFMQRHGGYTFSFNIGGQYKMSGTSTSTSTTISGGKKITTTIKKDFGSGMMEKTIIEEDLTTGARRIIQDNKDLTEL